MTSHRQARLLRPSNEAKVVLTGSAGKDRFWANLDTGGKDKITDLSVSELATDLDFLS